MPDETQEKLTRTPDGPGRYGGWYWCIKTAKGISQNGEIYVNADRLEVTPTGNLICWGGGRQYYERPPDKPQAVLAIAQGQWLAFFAASCMDGSAVAVDHWKGEVVR